MNTGHARKAVSGPGRHGVALAGAPSCDRQVVDAAATAAVRLGDHPQDHGWRELYRLFAHGLETDAPRLTEAVLAHQQARPVDSASHRLTVLGIALKTVSGSFDHLIDAHQPVDGRLAALEAALGEHAAELRRIVTSRQNSFTAARRFLVPQVLLGAYFARSGAQTVRFADLGTGLGIMPRQLNCEALFDRFAADLAWPGGTPAFRWIPLACRFAVDRGPMPDLSWVRACHGRSAYYTGLYRELVTVLETPEVADADVRFADVDLLDRRALSTFVRHHGINAVNLCYTLYQLAPERRADVIDTLRGALRSPGVIIVTEPHAELTQPGCAVTVFEEKTPSPRLVCSVSDGHFRGSVLPGEDFHSFVREYPIDCAARCA